MSEMRYPLVESFYTLQGEGFWAGQPAYFLRLGGCDVGCSWCDTQHSWPLQGWPLYTAQELLSCVAATPARHVVITGGEPTLHPLGELIQTLQAAGYFVQLETSGAYPLPELCPDWVTFSPKRFKPPEPLYYERANELKVVIHAPSDLKWAEEQRKRCRPSIPAFLQPDFYRQDQALEWILEHIKAHPWWRLSLQWHRYLNLP
ncbi:MAG: 7-carboxy-7-deazaguanine synthase [Bacteroidia bacterium]|nr:MAG: 7-carboxy-7-deazaguanine synthase [Bacteroidia bacterium]